MSPWTLVYDRFDPDQERLREALCTLGNGYFATRGAAPEADAGEVHYPGTYLACGYNRLQTEISGRVVENEDLVNLPNWLALTFRVDGGSWFELAREDVLSYRQELDLKHGVLKLEIRFRDVAGRESRLSERRLVHMGNNHLAALETTLTAENWSGTVELRSALDGRVTNQGVERYRRLDGRHLEAVSSEEVNEETLFLKSRTVQSLREVALAARTRVRRGGELVLADRGRVLREGYACHTIRVPVSQGDEVTVEKVVALFNSRDRAISECGLAARTEVGRAGSFEDLLHDHVGAWEHLWSRFDLRLSLREGADGAWTSRILRLHIFHLLQSVSPHSMDLDVGVPSRGWHGEAYRGHIFWDELFIFPFFNLRLPEITRSLLMYRFRRLDEARASAREAGYRGAMYPWQSGSDGREESQRLHLNPKSGRWIPDNSRLQRHVNAAIAYNVWQYYQATRDMEFLYAYGAEMMLEIARFWASLATYNPDRERYEIRGVMGPDEYHDGYPEADEPGLNNSAYTNVFAVWVLRAAAQALDVLPESRSEELRQVLGLAPKELRRWEDIASRMFVPFHGDGIISQFEGYENLEELDWEGYREEHGNIERLDRILEAEGDTPNRYRASKQADVLMLFYLFSAEQLKELFEALGYSFSRETIPKNIAYYMARTSHGSSLSRVVHSWVLARSDRKRSWKLFHEALHSDVADIQGGTTPEGIHLGAMAGTVDLIRRCYTGLETRGDVLWLNPLLPEELESLRMDLRYRGHSLGLEIDGGKLKVAALRCTERCIQVGVKGKVCEIEAGKTREWDLGQESSP
ncbi:MAG: glycosyl hydrolase family 65 protein [Deferrisomatales bacterium]|nr:glycosyl hydrolase family 65 protein [Deferrisomatales bacterium]